MQLPNVLVGVVLCKLTYVIIISVLQLSMPVAWTSTGINFAAIVYIMRHSEYVHIPSEIVP